MHLSKRLPLLLLALAGPLSAWAATPDEDAIRAVLMAEFDKPDARLAVQPVVVAGQHAIAGWFQGSRGGRALMRRHGSAWQIVLCSGHGLKNPQALRDAGIPSGAAARLLEDLARAEAALSPARRQQVSSFDGTVRMDAHGQHPPGHKP